MTKHKLTPWFPANVKPVRKGVYEVELLREPDCQPLGKGFANWSGEYWGNMYTSIYAANNHRSKGLQLKKWRGIQK